MAVAGERVGAATGFNQYVRPDNAGLDVDGGNLVDADTDLVLAKPRTLVTDDGIVRHLDDCGEDVISAGPAAGLKHFRIHRVALNQEMVLSNCFEKKHGCHSVLEIEWIENIVFKMREGCGRRFGVSLHIFDGGVIPEAPSSFLWC